jgi:hypothetical protein
MVKPLWQQLTVTSACVVLQHLYHVDIFSSDISAICLSAVYGPLGLSRGLSVTFDTVTDSRIAARWSQKQLIRSVQQAMDGAPQRRGTFRQVGQVFSDAGSNNTLHEVMGFKLRCCGMWGR